MSSNVVMPQMGESVTEGTITSWFKNAGDWVEKDESLLLIQTDKVDAEVPSPASGYLQKVLFPEGETVEIDTVIAVLSQEKASDTPPPTPSGEVLTEKPASAHTPISTESSSSANPKLETKSQDLDELRKTRSSPLVRKMAKEHDIALHLIKGSGISGRVTKKDFLAHLNSKPSARQQSPTKDAGRYAYQPIASDRLEPFSPMRGHIADHMVISRETSVHVTTVFEVDMTRIAKLRAKHKENYAQQNVKLSFMPFIVKAVTDGIAEYPIMNSAIVDRSVAYRQDVNIGMAVAVDWGLLVPVIPAADEKTIKGLSRSIADLANRARDRKLSPDELQGGTFTVTNPGVFGSLFGTPIINQPQVAILCVGTITKRAVVIEDDAIAVRSMMYLALSFDHRIIDGATADRFMKTVKDRLEAFPEELL